MYKRQLSRCVTLVTCESGFARGLHENDVIFSKCVTLVTFEGGFARGLRENDARYYEKTCVWSLSLIYLRDARRKLARVIHFDKKALRVRPPHADDDLRHL